MTKPVLELAQNNVRAEIIKEKDTDQEDGLRAEQKLANEIKKEKKAISCTLFWLNLISFNQVYI